MGLYVCVCSVTQSCPNLWDLMDYRPPGSYVLGMLQARILHWVAISSSQILDWVAFELWYWRRLLGFPCTTRRSNQSILKEISPKYSLQGLMAESEAAVYFGHLRWRTDLLEKTLMLGKIEGRRKRGRQRMRWLELLCYLSHVLRTVSQKNHWVWTTPIVCRWIIAGTRIELCSFNPKTIAAAPPLPVTWEPTSLDVRVTGHGTVLGIIVIATLQKCSSHLEHPRHLSQ